MSGGPPVRRVWFDVSFTRTQQGAIGITRTVRRLFAAPLPDGGEALALAYSADGFRSIPFPAAPQAAAAARPSAGERLFGWVTGGLSRRLVMVALKILPWFVLRPAWEAMASRTFDALARRGAPVAFRAGDMVVIADVAWNYPVWRAAEAARRQGASVVLLVYDLMPIRQPRFCFPLVPKVFPHFLRKMLACSDAVVCISRSTEDDLRRWAADEGVALPPAGHFRLGSDLAVDARAPAAVRPALVDFLSGPACCFAAVGSFEPKKNYPLLVRVFERLWARGEQVRLVMAGKETAESAQWTAALRDHPQQGRLFMTLHDASDAEIAAIYAGCGTLVFPSLYEGFGLPLVEARARGCRVIASDIPAFVELADSGVVLFASGDADALESALLAVAGGGDVRPPPAQPFGWDQSARQFYGVVDELLART